MPRVRKLGLAAFREAMTSNGDQRCKLIKAALECFEMRRQLLGFPSPGKRRDESDRDQRPVLSASVSAVGNERDLDERPVNTGSNEVGHAMSDPQSASTEQCQTPVSDKEQSATQSAT